MTTWEERFRPRPPAPPPMLEHVATLFRGRMIGGTGRVLRCAVYRVVTGFELRVDYEDNDSLVRSELFKVRDDQAIARRADEWHGALVVKGFEELSDGR
jgi:hypothetical protein